MSTTKKRLLNYSLLVLFMIFLFACAPTETVVKKKEVNELIWPPPPEQPRLAYITSLHGESDYSSSDSLDYFLGKQLMVRDLSKPYGVAAYNDKVYVTDASGSVFVFDMEAKKVSFIGEQGKGRLVSPTGVAISPDGTIFVSDVKQKKVFGYDNEGNLKVAIGKKDEFGRPAGLAIDPKSGILYVVDTLNHKINAYSMKGEALFTFGERGNDDGQFNFPTNIAVNNNTGLVYVVDTQNFRVQSFDKNGKFIKKFGSAGDRPGNFSRPKGIGIDSDNNIYVVDTAYENFQVFNDDGQILLFIGGAGTNPGLFWLPAGAYVDETDKVYIVDSFNRRVQVFQYISNKFKNDKPEEYKKYLFE